MKKLKCCNGQQKGDWPSRTDGEWRTIQNQIDLIFEEPPLENTKVYFLIWTMIMGIKRTIGENGKSDPAET